MPKKIKDLTPIQIVKELNAYIIGQEEAKRTVAIAFRDRWRRQNAKGEIRKEIIPNNILMKGSTGTGKTEIGRRLAQIADLPFVKVEATKYTEKGYVGADPESMIQDLGQTAMRMIKSEKEAQVKEEAIARVEQILLDILIPKTEESDPDEASLNRGTRARFLEKIRNGELNDRFIEISIEEKNPTIHGSMLEENAMMGLQDMFNRVMPKKKKKQKVTLKVAKRLLLQQEIDQMLEVDTESMKKEAQMLAQEGVIFLDEIDKIAAPTNKGSGPDVSREGVQRNLLPIIEGCTVNTRIGPIKTDNILFIAAGAFHNSQPSDLMPELQGRLIVRVAFENLTEENFYHILKNTKNSLIKQQKALFEAEGITLDFTEGALRALSHAAFTLNQEREDIGARRLRSILVKVLETYLFDVPDKIGKGTTLSIDEKYVKEKLATIMEEKDSSRYIL